jgi:hypothetical protein
MWPGGSLFMPDQIELDLSTPGLGHPRGEEIIQQHYRQGEQSRLVRDTPSQLAERHLSNTCIINLNHAIELANVMTVKNPPY